MSSKLLNLKYTLTWQDFKGQVPPNDPLTALTASDIERGNVNSEKVEGGFRLKDDITFKVVMRQNKSWAKKSVINAMTPQQQKDLLKHEQGHYDITALTARDMFIDLMQLKGQVFSTSNDLFNEVRAVLAKYDPQKIQDKYDSIAETDHGRKAANQKAWEGFIQKAFTQTRTPLVKAPDGTTYKVRLRDVLQAAGKKI